MLLSPMYIVPILLAGLAPESDFNPCVAGRSRDEFITQRCMR